MTANIAALCELFVANGTLVGTVSGVDAEMVAQVAALGEATGAVINFTLEVEGVAGAEGVRGLLYLVPAAGHSFESILGFLSKFRLGFLCLCLFR